jgi:formyltetrahydrofolate synthetase
MEKFFNIKCRTSGLIPDAVVLVATVRALKMHGGGPRVIPGRPLPDEFRSEHLELLTAGLPNLVRNIEIIGLFGMPVVVAVNRFSTDTDREVEIIRESAIKAGALSAVASTHFQHGSEGSVDLARAVASACDEPSTYRPLYDLELPLRDKIETIATKVYGADGVEYDSLARRQLDRYEEQGFGGLPICMAKTHLSISHDPTLKGDPRGFQFPIREVRAAAGAGYIYPLAGEMRTMPGLGSRPAYMNVDVTDDGRIKGLF